MSEALFYLFSLLMVKHLIIDFPLQKPYQYLNKGTYGHPGGVLHSSLHGAGTFGVFLIFVSLPVAALAALIDTLVHYHIDWSKVNINKHFGWGPTTHEEFWWLLGLDQFLHMMTYILLIFFFL